MLIFYVTAITLCIFFRKPGAKHQVMMDSSGSHYPQTHQSFWLIEKSWRVKQKPGIQVQRLLPIWGLPNHFHCYCEERGWPEGMGAACIIKRSWKDDQENYLGPCISRSWQKQMRMSWRGPLAQKLTSLARSQGHRRKDRGAIDSVQKPIASS